MQDKINYQAVRQMRALLSLTVYLCLLMWTYCPVKGELTEFYVTAWCLR